MMSFYKLPSSLVDQNEIDEIRGIIFLLEICLIIIGYYCIFKKSVPKSVDGRDQTESVH